MTISITLDDQLVAEAREAAGGDDCSALVAEALRDLLDRRAARAPDWQGSLTDDAAAALADFDQAWRVPSAG
jgi:Arc/MetJ family transcription regulator